MTVAIRSIVTVTDDRRPSGGPRAGAGRATRTGGAGGLTAAAGGYGAWARGLAGWAIVLRAVLLA